MQIKNDMRTKYQKFTISKGKWQDTEVIEEASFLSAYAQETIGDPFIQNYIKQNQWSTFSLRNINMGLVYNKGSFHEWSRLPNLSRITCNVKVMYAEGTSDVYYPINV